MKEEPETRKQYETINFEKAGTLYEVRDEIEKEIISQIKEPTLLERYEIITRQIHALEIRTSIDDLLLK